MSGIYVTAKKIQPRKKGLTRLQIAKNFMSLLEFDMLQFKHMIEREHEVKDVHKDLQKLINNFCIKIFKTIDTYPLKNGQISKRGNDLIEDLHNGLYLFDESYTNLSKRIKISVGEHEIISKLISSVFFFTTEYKKTASAIKVRTKIPERFTHESALEFIKNETKAIKNSNSATKILPFRPKNWELVKIFETETKKYQELKGNNKFLSHKKFSQALHKHDITNFNKTGYMTISAKGYYLLKMDWKANQLHRIV